MHVNIEIENLAILDLFSSLKDNIFMEDISIIQPLKTLESLYLEKKYKEFNKHLLDNKSQFDLQTFHFFLGTGHIKKGNYAVGRYHLEKSIELGNINNEVINNLNFAKEKLNIDESVYSKKDVLLDKLLLIPDTLFISMTLTSLLIIVLMLRFKYIKKKWTLLILVLFSFLPVLVNNFYLNNVETAITLHPTKIKEGPSKIYSDTINLQEGEKIYLSKYENGYYYIVSPVVHNGWVLKKDLGVY